MLSSNLLLLNYSTQSSAAYSTLSNPGLSSVDVLPNVRGTCGLHFLFPADRNKQLKQLTILLLSKVLQLKLASTIVNIYE